MKIAIIIILVLVFLIAVVVVVGAMLPREHIARRSTHFLTSPSVVWAVINGPPIGVLTLEVRNNFLRRREKRL